MNNGNLTQWSPIWSVIIRMITKIVRPRSGSPIFLITSMITDRIGRQEGHLPINQNNDKIWKRNWISVICVHKNNSLLGEMRDNSARTWRVLSAHTTWRVNCPVNGPITLSNSKHDAHAVLLCSNRQALDNQTRSRIFLQFRLKKHNKDLRRERTNSQDQNVLIETAPSQIYSG